MFCGAYRCLEGQKYIASAFGSDSFIELVSAAVVLLQFVPRLHISSVRAAKLCGLLLYGLAGVVLLIALGGLFQHANADTSLLGISVTGGALLLMPVLARLKRTEAHWTGNKAFMTLGALPIQLLPLGNVAFRQAFSASSASQREPRLD